MKPLRSDGSELDSNFTVESSGVGAAYLFLESRGGSETGPRKSRNADYAEALELLLQRLASLGVTLLEVEVVSRVTKDWPPEKRRVIAPSFPLPLHLDAVHDFHALRIELGRAAVRIGQAPGVTGGQQFKRLRLTLTWPEQLSGPAQLEARLAGEAIGDKASGPSDQGKYAPLGKYLRAQVDPTVRLSLEDIEAILGAPLPPEARTNQFWANAAAHHSSRRRQWLGAGYSAYFHRNSGSVRFERLETAPFEFEEPTDDPDQLRVRSEAAKRKYLGLPKGKRPAPAGAANPGTTQSPSRRFLRDPNVVAWVLLEANGVCEVCDNNGPFQTASADFFLEVHHVRPLAEGGPDQPDNALAACPNCHRRLHLGLDREQVREATIAKIDRLADYPRRPVL